MHAELLVALLSLLGTLIGSVSGIVIANKLVNFRLDALERKVESLCRLAERVAVVEHEVKSAASPGFVRDTAIRQ